MALDSWWRKVGLLEDACRCTACDIRVGGEHHAPLLHVID